MSELLNFAKELEKGGLFLILLITIGGLVWWILRQEERGAAKLTAAIESLYANLAERTKLDTQWQGFIQETLSKQISQQTASTASIQAGVEGLTRDMTALKTALLSKGIEL
jgi:hypothetical protein